MPEQGKAAEMRWSGHTISSVHGVSASGGFRRRHETEDHEAKPATLIWSASSINPAVRVLHIDQDLGETTARPN
jgi:hypothetical protein